MSKIKIFILRVIRPYSTDIYLARKEKILNILLLSSIILSSIALLVALSEYVLKLISKTNYPGDNPTNILIFLLLFSSLLIFSKKGYSYISSFIFVTLYYFAAAYTQISWGVDVPQGILTYALLLTISSIILDIRLSILITLLSIVSILSITKFQLMGILTVDSYWKNNFLDFRDSIVTSVTLGIIALVSWLSNREIDRSFQRAIDSERALKNERDNLEIRVEERTEELKKAQLDKLTQLYKFAEFGKLAAGLVHELVNPLTSVSVNLEQLHGGEIEKIDKKQLSSVLKRAVEGTQEMEHYVQAARKQIQQQEIIKKFSISEEINQCIKMFSYRAKTEKVDIIFTFQSQILTYGNPIKFHQILGNLIANALDSYKESKGGNKKILINMKLKKDIISVTVVDRGKGITSSEIKKIFDPFFTTKKEYGTGIGLSITRDIIKNTFHGSIDVESSPSKGTIFTLIFPQKNNGKED